MIATLKTQSLIPIEDRVDIEDALYRFAAGQDLKERMLLESAFARGAVLDFSHPASRMGLTIEPFEGREAIAEAVWGATSELDTTHTITNVRILAFEDGRARLTALIEAQHLPRHDQSRNLLLKHVLAVELIRENGGWLIDRMEFRNVWREGDPRVLFPLAA